MRASGVPSLCLAWAGGLAVAVGGCDGTVSTGRAAVDGREEAPMELVEITNGHVVVGVLPSLGGRVVELKTTDGENLLDSDP